MSVSNPQCFIYIRERHIFIKYLTIFVGLLIIQMAFSVDEPDYANIVYGDVWRHVIPEPPDDSADVLQASKDLWHISSDQIPHTVTKFVKDARDNSHPVSLPVSLGSTYNFQITFKNNETMTIHYMTVTKGTDFYVYSHTFYSVNLADFDKSENFCSTSCPGKGLESDLDLHILSNLARNKELRFHSSKQFVDQSTASAAMNHEPVNLWKNIPDDTKSESNQETQNVLFDRSTLKVMSYNIWNFFDYHGQNRGYTGRIGRLLKVLDKAQPDIVGFQEIRLETPLGGRLGPSQMDHLMKQMPHYQFVYQPAMMHDTSLQQGRTEEGVAIFSRFPIVHHDYLLLFRNLSNSADTHQRVCLHAVVSVPVVGKVHIFNTHFSLSHEAREEAVKQILKFMELYGDEPMILMGDLNATPDEKSIRILVDNTGLVDIWDSLYPKSDGFTYSLLEEKLFKRIDYMFLKQKLQQLKIQDIEVVADKIKSEAASDHAAVMATFSFKDTK